jgi:hypothetical protein
VVVESNPSADHLHQPRIRMATDSGRRPAPGVLVDLSQPGEEHRAILHCVDPEEFGITSARYAF